MANGSKNSNASNESFDPLYSPQVAVNGDGLRKFSDELLQYYKGKIIEIYIGDQAENLEFVDHSAPQNATIFGRLIEVLDRFLVLDCFYVDKAGNVQSDNRVLINSFQIRVMTEVNENGSLDDIFLSAKDVKHVKKFLGKAK